LLLVIISLIKFWWSMVSGLAPCVLATLGAAGGLGDSGVKKSSSVLLHCCCVWFRFGSCVEPSLVFLALGALGGVSGGEHCDRRHHVSWNLVPALPDPLFIRCCCCCC